MAFKIDYDPEAVKKFAEEQILEEEQNKKEQIAGAVAFEEVAGIMGMASAKDTAVKYIAVSETYNKEFTDKVIDVMGTVLQEVSIIVDRAEV